jgi:glycosyltransferase involved in cell wall biosynthesis
MKNNLKVALLSPGNPYDKRNWSGTSFFLMHTIEKHIGEIEWICPNPPRFMKPRKIWSKMKFMVSGNREYPERTLQISQCYAKEISRKLEKGNYDLIFGTAANVEMSFLNTSIPMVYISDATFSLVKNTYPIFSNLSKEAQEAEEIFEQSVINKSNLLIYPSDWAARSSMQDYGADPSKVRVLPFGANLGSIPNMKEVSQKRIAGKLNLLFLGKEWERKGGPIAVETLKELLKIGINAKLTICGVVPPKEYAHPQIEIIPYLDKNSQTGRDRLKTILDESHLLLVPSRAECYGMVFCEANAYGIPVFAADVGGISSIVINGENGYLLPVEAGGREFSKAIAEIVHDEEKYATLIEGSKKRYENTLNWDSWGKRMRHEIQDKLAI